jgi:hypothetical protein
MLNSEKLTGRTEYMTLNTVCRINRCRVITGFDCITIGYLYLS